MATSKAPNIKRWSDQKLETELGRAVLSRDVCGNAENLAWITKLKIEVVRRRAFALVSA